MRSLWILDISESEHSRLEKCLSENNRLSSGHWAYTRLQVSPITDAESFIRVRADLFKAARAQVDELMRQGLLNDPTFTVCVVGDIRSSLTRSLLPFVSVIYKLHWGKMLPLNPNIGLRLCGFFYCPYQINQFGLEEQAKYALFFEELNQIQRCEMLGRYDMLVPYSDIQPVGHQSYPQLTDEQKDELLFEYLRVLFAHKNPAGMEVLANETEGFVSMGAASVFYDPDYFKRIAVHEIQNDLLRLFKEKKDPDELSSDAVSLRCKEREEVLSLLWNESSVMRKTQVLEALNVSDANITADFKQIERGNTIHPVWDFYKPLLYPKYYLRQLRFYPARIKEYMQFYSNALRKRIVARMEKSVDELAARTYELVDLCLEEFLGSTKIRYKTLSQAESMLETLREKLKAELECTLTEIQSVGYSPVTIPEFLSPHIHEIDSEKADFNKLLDSMKSVLQKEPVFMAAIVRCLLVGTTAVFCLLPLLRALSPRLINLGTVSSAEPFWIGILLVIPFIYMLGWKLRRHFKRVRLLRHKIWAYALYSLRQELTHNLSEMTQAYYDKVCAYCDQSLATIRQIRAEYQPNVVSGSRSYQETFFNRPLLNEQTADLMNKQIRFSATEVKPLVSEEDRYRLLSIVLAEIDKDFLKKTNDEGGIGMERMEKHCTQMRERIEKRLLLTEYDCITDFVVAMSNDPTRRVDFIAPLLERAYPVGLYVDSSAMHNLPCLRMRKSYESGRTSYRIVEDVNEDKDVMTSFFIKPLRNLEAICFLSIESDAMSVDFTAELLCYYYYYLSNHRGSVFHGHSYSEEELRALDVVLKEGEKQL